MMKIMFIFCAIAAMPLTAAQAGALGAQRFLPLHQDALKRPAVIVEKDDDAPKRTSRFLPLNRGLVTVSRSQRSPKRHGANREYESVELPDTAQEAVLMLYGDAEVGRNHPFNR